MFMMRLYIPSSLATSLSHYFGRNIIILIGKRKGKLLYLTMNITSIFVIACIVLFATSTTVMAAVNKNCTLPNECLMKLT